MTGFGRVAAVMIQLNERPLTPFGRPKRPFRFPPFAVMKSLVQPDLDQTAN